MNLGQLIGEMRMKAEGIEHRTEAPVLKVEPTRRPDRQTQVLELARRPGGVACRDLVAALGISGGNASVVLFTMHQIGKLNRTGERGQYRYEAAA